MEWITQLDSSQHDWKELNLCLQKGLGRTGGKEAPQSHKLLLYSCKVNRYLSARWSCCNLAYYVSCRKALFLRVEEGTKAMLFKCVSKLLHSSFSRASLLEHNFSLVSRENLKHLNWHIPKLLRLSPVQKWSQPGMISTVQSKGSLQHKPNIFHSICQQLGMLGVRSFLQDMVGKVPFTWTGCIFLYVYFGILSILGLKELQQETLIYVVDSFCF